MKSITIKAKEFPLKEYTLMPAIDLPFEIGPGIKKMLHDEEKTLRVPKKERLKFKRGLLGWQVIGNGKKWGI